MKTTTRTIVNAIVRLLLDVRRFLQASDACAAASAEAIQMCTLASPSSHSHLFRCAPVPTRTKHQAKLLALCRHCDVASGGIGVFQARGVLGFS